MPTERFKSKEAYRKSRAYTHIHGIPTHAKRVCVAGKCHDVKHSRLSSRKLGGKKKVQYRTSRKTARKKGE